MGDELSMQTQIIILDDDPTGIQTVHGCLALTCWDAETLCRAFEDACPFFYVLTNTRAYAREQARQIVVDAVQAIVTVNRAYQRRLVFISRSDSTLRSHFPLEIEKGQTTLTVMVLIAPTLSYPINVKKIPCSINSKNHKIVKGCQTVLSLTALIIEKLIIRARNSILKNL